MQARQGERLGNFKQEVAILEYILLISFLLLPKVGAVDLSFMPLAICAASVFFSGLKNRDGGFKIDRGVMVTAILTALMFAVSCLSYLVNMTDVVSEFIFKPIRILFIILILALYAKNNSVSFDKVLRVVMIAALLNGAVVILQYLAHAYYGIPDLLLNENFKERAITPYRKPGLMSGFPVAGLLGVLGFIVAMYYASLAKSTWMYLAIAFFIFISILLTSRLALLLCLIMFIGFGIKKLVSLDFKAILWVGMTAALGIGFITYALSSGNDVYVGTFNKMFANVINLEQDGSAYDDSTRDLVQNHYIVPDNIGVMLIGNSVDPSSNIVNSDVFYIRYLWGNGVFLVALYLLSMVWMVYGIHQLRKINRGQKFIFYLFCFVVCVASLKGAYIFSRVIGDAVLLAYLAARECNEQRAIDG